MGDEAKLRQAIDILSSISGSGSASDGTSGGSSASGGSSSHRRPDRSRATGSGESFIILRKSLS